MPAPLLARCERGRDRLRVLVSELTLRNIGAEVVGEIAKRAYCLRLAGVFKIEDHPNRLSMIGWNHEFGTRHYYIWPRCGRFGARWRKHLRPTLSCELSAVEPTTAANAISSRPKTNCGIEGA